MCIGFKEKGSAVTLPRIPCIGGIFTVILLIDQIAVFIIFPNFFRTKNVNNQ